MFNISKIYGEHFYIVQTKNSLSISKRNLMPLSHQSYEICRESIDPSPDIQSTIILCCVSVEPRPRRISQ